MTTEEKFQAAVNVIKGLPKSGSYQPSNDLMLRFYSYFKQATEGPCTKSKPAFWDIVNKAKWEAWNKLGKMSRESAMEAYVAELHKIVETMSYTDNVAAFFDTVDSDVAVSKDDLYLVAGDVLRKTTSSPPTPTGQRDPCHCLEAPQLHNGHAPDSEDEYIDTVDSEENEMPVRQVTPVTGLSNGHATLPASDSYYSAKTIDTNNIVLDQLRRTVQCLEMDVAQLKQKVALFEREKNRLERSFLWRRPAWWPLKDVSPAVLTAIILWPIIANRIVDSIRRRK